MGLVYTLYTFCHSFIPENSVYCLCGALGIVSITMVIGSSIKVLSANCQGLQDLKKRCDVLSYFKDRNADIICLEDTHLIEKDYDNVKKIWESYCILHRVKTNSRDIAVFLKK